MKQTPITWVYLMVILLIGVYYLGFIINDLEVILSSAATISILCAMFYYMEKRIEKQSILVFGFKDPYKHFFGLDKKDFKMSLKEFLEVEKYDRTGKEERSRNF